MKQQTRKNIIVKSPLYSNQLRLVKVQGLEKRFFFLSAKYKIQDFLQSLGKIPVTGSNISSGLVCLNICPKKLNCHTKQEPSFVPRLLIQAVLTAII